jgi:hypothetical protein
MGKLGRVSCPPGQVASVPAMRAANFGERVLVHASLWSPKRSFPGAHYLRCAEFAALTSILAGMISTQNKITVDAMLPRQIVTLTHFTLRGSEILIFFGVPGRLRGAARSGTPHHFSAANSQRNQAFAYAQWRLAVAREMPITSAVSSIEKPAK